MLDQWLNVSMIIDLDSDATYKQLLQILTQDNGKVRFFRISICLYIYINICVYWYLNRYIYIYIYVLKRLSGQFFYNLEGKNIQYIGDLTCFYLIQIVQFLILHYPVHTVYGYTGNDCQTSRQLCDYIGNYFYTFRQPYGYTINSSLSIVLSLHCLRITYSTEK